MLLLPSSEDQPTGNGVILEQNPKPRESEA